MSKKIINFICVSFLFLAITSPSANADHSSFLDNDISNIEQIKLEELNNQDLIVPLGSPTDPFQENFGGTVGGFTVMGKSVATSFVKKNGYKDVHDFKYAYLGRNAPIDYYDLHYTKGSVRYVYM